MVAFSKTEVLKKPQVRKNMYVIWIMVFFLLLYIIRLLKGPTIWDRFLGLSLISTKIGIITILFASMNNFSYLLDFVIACILLWFMCINFTALFIQERIKKEEKKC